MLLAAKIFDLPGVTEQYPKGLGTVGTSEIAAAAEACGHPIFSKIEFQCVYR